MLITKKYQCQSCFRLNEIDIESTYCSETTDLIEDLKRIKKSHLVEGISCLMRVGTARFELATP